MQCCNSNYNITNLVNQLSGSSIGRDILGSGMLNSCICCATPKEYAPDIAAYAHYRSIGQDSMVNYTNRCCQLNARRYFY